jgi:hypothetical protein
MVCGADECNGPCKSCAHALPAFKDLEERTRLAERKADHLWGELRLLLRRCSTHMDVNEDGTTKIPDEIVLHKNEIEDLIALINPGVKGNWGQGNCKYLTDDINMLGIVCTALDLFNPEKHRAKTTKAKLEELYKSCESYLKYSQLNTKPHPNVKKTELRVSVEEIIQTIKNNDEEKIVAKR